MGDGGCGGDCAAGESGVASHSLGSDAFKGCNTRGAGGIALWVRAGWVLSGHLSEAMYMVRGPSGVLLCLFRHRI